MHSLRWGGFDRRRKEKAVSKVAKRVSSETNGGEEAKERNWKAIRIVSYKKFHSLGYMTSKDCTLTELITNKQLTIRQGLGIWLKLKWKLRKSSTVTKGIRRLGGKMSQIMKKRQNLTGPTQPLWNINPRPPLLTNLNEIII